MLKRSNRTQTTLAVAVVAALVGLGVHYRSEVVQGAFETVQNTRTGLASVTGLGGSDSQAEGRPQVATPSKNETIQTAAGPGENSLRRSAANEPMVVVDGRGRFRVITTTFKQRGCDRGRLCASRGK